MTKTIVQTDQAPQSPFYSQAVKAGGLIFVSDADGWFQVVRLAPDLTTRTVVTAGDEEHMPDSSVRDTLHDIVGESHLGSPPDSRSSMTSRTEPPPPPVPVLPDPTDRR